MLHTENFTDFLKSSDEKLRIDCIREGCLYSLTLTNTSDQKCRIGDLTLLSAEMPFAPLYGRTGKDR